MELYKTINDRSGNPRVVVHFLDLLKKTEQNGSITQQYKIAKERASLLGGRVYKGKDFGGGFVFQCWDEKKLIKTIENETKI